MDEVADVPLVLYKGTKTRVISSPIYDLVNRKYKDTIQVLKSFHICVNKPFNWEATLRGSKRHLKFYIMPFRLLALGRLPVQIKGVF